MKDMESEEIARRVDICLSCPYNSDNAQTSEEYLSLFGESYNPDGQTKLHCSICSCYLSMKTSCLTCNCGLEYYNEQNNTNIPLKWTKIKD